MYRFPGKEFFLRGRKHWASAFIVVLGLAFGVCVGMQIHIIHLRRAAIAILHDAIVTAATNDVVQTGPEPQGVTMTNTQITGFAGGEWERVEPGPKLPTAITVNGERWLLVEASGMFSLGKTICERRTIFYRFTGDSQEDRNTIVHEIFHAGGCLHGGYRGYEWWNSIDTEHTGIWHLADFTSTLIWDNPALVKWLSSRD